jgi:hypothetical protein
MVVHEAVRQGCGATNAVLTKPVVLTGEPDHASRTRVRLVRVTEAAARRAVVATVRFDSPRRSSMAARRVLQTGHRPPAARLGCHVVGERGGATGGDRDGRQMGPHA